MPFAHRFQLRHPTSRHDPDHRGNLYRRSRSSSPYARATGGYRLGVTLPSPADHAMRPLIEPPSRLRTISSRAVSPRWRWLSIGALIVIGTCVRLSIWQFDRLAERTAAQATASARAEAPPVALDAPGRTDELLAMTPAELSTYEMRRASVRGTYDHEHDEALTMQVVDGRLGVRLLSPLRVVGAGSAILIDRGWLPVDYDRPVKWIPFRVQGDVSVEGRLRPGFRRPNAKTPPEDAGLVADLDLNQIAAGLPYPLIGLVLVESPSVGAPAPDSLPIKHELQAPQADIPHLAYAVQWLAFALIVAGGYVGLVASDGRTVQRAPRVRTTTL